MTGNASPVRGMARLIMVADGVAAFEAGRASAAMPAPIRLSAARRVILPHAEPPSVFMQGSDCAMVRTRRAPRGRRMRLRYGDSIVRFSTGCGAQVNGNVFGARLPGLGLLGNE